MIILSRQACDHPYLVINATAKVEAAKRKKAEELAEQAGEELMEPMEELTQPIDIHTEYKSSTKITALLADLTKIRMTDSKNHTHTKCVVFSQVK